MLLSGTGGGLMARASVDGSENIFPLLVDTGTVLTAYDGGPGVVRAHTGDFRLFGVDGTGKTIPRIDLRDIQLFTTPMGTIGVDDAVTQVGGVIGGDNLARFAVTFDYRGAAPSMTVVENLQPCSCELEPRLDQPDACDSVLTFSLAGGNDSALQGQTRIIIGNDQYSYPPTRVLVDTCLEPQPDPLTTTVPGLPSYGTCGVHCSDKSCKGQLCPAVTGPFMPNGVDVRMIVATGFPGLALSAEAYDRLRGPLAADGLLAGPTVTLRLPDGADAGGIQAAVTTLGKAPSGTDPGASALALVSREKYYGPCTLLARGRRQRWAAANGGTPSSCLFNPDNACLQTDGQIAPPDVVKACSGAVSAAEVCYDDGGGSSGEHAPTPAVIEMTTQLPVYVIRDLAPLLVGINADVRPTDSTVEGVIGTEVLKRLVTTLDYPGSRIVARCASNVDCKAYSRLSVPSSPAGTCDNFCQGGALATTLAIPTRPPQALQPCPVAP
jgi:hypothetical protein